MGAVFLKLLSGISTYSVWNFLSSEIFFKKHRIKLLPLRSLGIYSMNWRYHLLWRLALLRVHKFKLNQIHIYVWHHRPSLLLPFKPWFKISVMESAINIGNIGADMRWYYKVNIISDISKPDMILLLFIGISRYLKPCFKLYVVFDF